MGSIGDNGYTDDRDDEEEIKNPTTKEQVRALQRAIKKADSGRGRDAAELRSAIQNAIWHTNDSNLLNKLRGMLDDLDNMDL